MKKLIALYRAPPDAEAFMAHYREAHLPLVEKIPGLVRTELTLIDQTFIGEAGGFLMAEMFFADAESFRAAMRSPENAATGADLARFAKGLVTVMAGSVIETDTPPRQ